jgi:tetratricopeptide (TPR) repeat protein
MYRTGRYDEAFDAYERAAKLNPDLGDDLYFKLGNIAFKRQDHARARSSWTRAIELNPGHQLARANLEQLEGAT